MRSSLLIIVLALLGGCIEYEPGTGVDPNDTNDTFPPGTPVPDIEVTPGDMPFGNWTTECPSSPRTVTIRNVGDEGSTLEITEIALAEGITAFGVEGATTGSLGVADRLEFGVWFQPPTDDAFDGIARVTSNDPDEGITDVGLSGLGAGSPPFEVMDRFEQNLPNEVDVLFVVDNSCSMADEQATLGDSFATFMDSFIAMGIDFHLAVTSTAMDDGGGSYDAPLMGKFAGDPTILDASMPQSELVTEFRTLASLGANGSGTEKGLDAAHAALTAPLINGYNTGFLRATANLAIVVLSDEADSSSMAPAPFTAWLDSMKPDEDMTSLSTITGTVEGGLLFIEYCDPDHKLTSNSTQYGAEYIEVADSTGGTARDICETDWNSLVKFLSYSAAGLATEFELTEEPAGVGSITVLVDGAEVAYDLQNGWSYDAGENSIVFNGNSMPGPDQDVVVTYDVDSADACN